MRRVYSADWDEFVRRMRHRCSGEGLERVLDEARLSGRITLVVAAARDWVYEYDQGKRTRTRQRRIVAARRWARVGELQDYIDTDTRALLPPIRDATVTETDRAFWDREARRFFQTMDHSSTLKLSRVHARRLAEADFTGPAAVLECPYGPPPTEGELTRLRNLIRSIRPLTGQERRAIATDIIDPDRALALAIAVLDGRG